MNLLRLAWKNVADSPFRSAMVFLCVALVSGSAVLSTLILWGAEENLRQSVDRLGADIIIVPWGTDRWEIEDTRLMGLQTEGWLSRADLDRVSSVPGVAIASPQLHLATLEDSPFCAEAEMFVVAFDPATDFTVQAWLPVPLEHGLRVGEAIVGSQISAPAGAQSLMLLGYEFALTGRLLPTGTGLDQSIFVSFETAQDLARRSPTQVAYSADVAAQNASVILIKVELSSAPTQVAAQIMRQAPGVIPYESTHFFQKGRNRMADLLRSIPALLGVTWGLSVVFIGLAFSIAVNERRRQIGVLRALGSPRPYVLRTLLAEGFIVALGGGAAGVALALLSATLFREEIVRAAGLPLLALPPWLLLALALGGLLLGLGSATVAALPSAVRIVRQEPVVAMRG